MRFLRVLHAITFNQKAPCFLISFVALILSVTVTNSAFALGGGKSSSMYAQQNFYGGVHSYGIHFGGDKQASILICEGSKCEQAPEPCSMASYSSCKDAQSCQALGAHFTWNSSENICTCAPGYSGDQCSNCTNKDLCDISCRPGYTGNHCDICAEGHTGSDCLTCKEGWAKGSTEPLWRCMKGVYCLKTNWAGECENWGTCPLNMNSSGDKIVGVPNAIGACTDTSDKNIVCGRTNAQGACEEWISCLKNVKVHNIVGTPNAYQSCCTEGEMFCQNYDDNTCTRWDCGSCSSDTPQFCHSAAECTEIGYTHYDSEHGCYNCQDTKNYTNSSPQTDAGCSDDNPICGAGTGINAASNNYGNKCYQCVKKLNHYTQSNENLGIGSNMDIGCSQKLDFYLCESEYHNFGTCRRCMNNKEDDGQIAALSFDENYVDLGCSPEARFCQADANKYSDVCGSCINTSCVHGFCNSASHKCDCINGFDGESCNICDDKHTGENDCIECARGYYNKDPAEFEAFLNGDFDDMTDRPTCSPTRECDTFIVVNSNGLKKCAGKNGEECTSGGTFYCSKMENGLCTQEDCCKGQINWHAGANGEDICLPCSSENLEACSEEECAVLGSNYTWDPQLGCIEKPHGAPCSEDSDCVENCHPPGGRAGPHGKGKRAMKAINVLVTQMKIVKVANFVL